MRDTSTPSGGPPYFKQARRQQPAGSRHLDDAPTDPRSLPEPAATARPARSAGPVALGSADAEADGTPATRVGPATSRRTATPLPPRVPRPGLLEAAEASVAEDVSALSPPVVSAAAAPAPANDRPSTKAAAPTRTPLFATDMINTLDCGYGYRRASKPV